MFCHPLNKGPVVVNANIYFNANCFLRSGSMYIIRFILSLKGIATAIDIMSRGRAYSDYMYSGGILHNALDIPCKN